MIEPVKTGLAALAAMFLALTASGVSGRSFTSSPEALAKALLATPIRDARLASYGRARTSVLPEGLVPGAVGAEIEFSRGGASIVYAVYPSHGDGQLGWRGAAPPGSAMRTVEPGPSWLPGSPGFAFIVRGTSQGKGITEVVFLDGVVGIATVTSSATNRSSGDMAGALTLARVALEHLDSVERSIGWTPPPQLDAYQVPASSMEPTLHCAQPQPGCKTAVKDYVLATPLARETPRRGDILLFKTPPQAVERCGAGGTFIKRLIGLPGDVVKERNGFISIDGNMLDEPYVPQNERDDQNFGPVKIPPSHYFLMGDNRQASCDSRVWGSVPRENLIARVVTIVRGSKRLSVLRGR